MLEECQRIALCFYNSLDNDISLFTESHNSLYLLHILDNKDFASQ